MTSISQEATAFQISHSIRYALKWTCWVLSAASYSISGLIYIYAVHAQMVSCPTSKEAKEINCLPDRCGGRCCFVPPTWQLGAPHLKNDLSSVEPWPCKQDMVRLDSWPHGDAKVWIFYVKVKTTVIKSTRISSMLVKTHWIISSQPFCSIQKVFTGYQKRWWNPGWWILVSEHSSLICFHLLCVWFPSYLLSHCF